MPALGLHLRRRYGAAYYALGLLFGKGAFRARRGQDLTRPAARHRIGSAGPRSIESRLAAATPGDHLVDLRAAEAAPAVAEWLREGHFQRSFGANVPRLAYRFNLAPTVPAEEYDGLAYVATTTCSRPLPQGSGPT